MPKMTEIEEIAFWEKVRKQGEKFRLETAIENQWAVYRAYYRNEFDEGILPENLVFPLIKSIVPRVYFRDPKVIITPQRPGFSVQAKILETIDNWVIRQMRLKKSMKRIIQDACTYGTGIGKSGYDSEFGYDAEEQRTKSEVEQYFNATGTWEEDTEVIEYDESILPGTPWYKRVHGNNLILPYGCEDVKDTWCVIHKVVRHIDDVKADRKYVKTDRLTPTHTLAAKYGKEMQRRPGMALDTDYVVLYEITDLRTKRSKVIAEGHNFFLRNDIDELLAAGNPYDLMVFNEDDASAWGLSDVMYLDPQQREINEISTQYRTQRQLSVLKVLAREGLFSPEQRERFMSGELGALVEVAGSMSDDIRASIMQFEPRFTNELLEAKQVVRESAREQVGFSRNEQGDYDTSSRRTAYEASLVHAAHQIRVDERRDVAADMYVDIIQRINKYIFKFWTEQRYAEVVGPDNAKYWVNYTGAMLRGDYYYQVDPDTSQQRSSELRKSEALQLLQVVGSLPIDRMANQDGSPKVKLDGLLEYVLDQFQSVDTMRIINPNGAPMMDGQVMSIDQLKAMMGQMGQMGGAQNASLRS